MNRLLPVACAGLLLASCMTYDVDRGTNLIAQGRVDEGLAELERISRENPGSAQARGAYVTQRSAIVGQIVNDADTARLWGQFDEADRLYQRALRIEPSNPSALGGLDLVARERHWAKLVAEGEMLLKNGNRAGAESLARKVLAESSSNRPARLLMRSAMDVAAAQEIEPPQLRAAMQKPVTLEFRDAPLRSVFEVISRTSGINFVFDRDVRADLRTTIFVRDTNLDDVLKLLLLTNQLDRKVVNENSVLVFPNTAAKQKDYAELVVRTFYLANADAKQTAQLVRTVAKTRDIYIDEKLNLLVVKDTPQAVKLVEKLIATQDLGEPEVLLEVEVLEVSRNKLNELGINPADQLSFGVGLAGTTNGGTTTAAPPLVQVNSPGFRWFVPNPAAVVRLRGTAAAADILANPRIRVKNREKAKIHIGEKVPVITTTSTANVGVSSSVSYLDTGLKLDVEPNVYLEDEVAIKVQLEVSNIIEQLNINGTLAYRLGTRNTATTLRLKDGETQMLAGLISDTDTRATEGLPYAAQTPILKRLFANRDERTKTEIVLLITPRVVRNVVRPETVPAQFFSGTEASIGAMPMTLRPTAARALSVSPSGGAPGGAGAAPAPAARAGGTATTSLLWVAPTQAAIGEEFSISIALPPGADVRSANVDLAWDPRVLQAVNSPEAGRASVALQGSGIAGSAPSSPAEVRFRVIAPSAQSTAITVTAQGVDPGGLPVSVAGPGVHTVQVQPK
jgi:general secretion pathway protein D